MSGTKTEEIFDFLVDYLSQISPPPAGGRRSGARSCDLRLPDVASRYWHQHLDIRRMSAGQSAIDVLSHDEITSFYDAAWDLCRLGVLRPGRFGDMGRGYSPEPFGEDYSITEFGFSWLKSASEREYVGARMSDVLTSLGLKFGESYRQRANEAVRSYRTNNWLAACTMAGAAAESVLISIAIEKTQDEKRVLKAYNAASGRSAVTRMVTHDLSPSLRHHFETALLVLHYWRDSASHGVAVSIGEIEANNGLTQLLRLVQLANKHWDQLTSAKS